MKQRTKRLMKKYGLNKERFYWLIENAFFYHCSEDDLDEYLEHKGKRFNKK